MRILGTIEWEEVIRVWLRSEWYKPPRTLQADRKLVDHPDLSDPDENTERLTLLCIDRGRSPIISLLPSVPNAKLVNVTPGDLSELYIVPTPEWYMDTGGTYMLTDTLANLKPGRCVNYGNGFQPINTYADVRAKTRYLAGYDASTTDEALILIAPREDGPYTIIDGTHRAAALYLNHLQSTNMPWKAILIDRPEVAYCRWHIDSRIAREAIRNYSSAAAQGSLR